MKIEVRNYLEHSIMEFSSWLDIDMPDMNISWESDPKDWLMKIRGEDQLVFNYDILSVCSTEFYELVVVHEYYHFVQNNLPNKADVKTLRDHFGNSWMLGIDIEADTVTANYFRESKGLTWEKYLRTLHEGSTVFAGSLPRHGKFERWLGSFLSVYKAFQTGKTVVYLPSVVSFSLTGQLWIMEIGSGLRMTPVVMRKKMFKGLAKCFKATNTISYQDFYNTLTEWGSFVQY